MDPMRGLDELTRTKMRIQAKPWFASNMSDEDKAGYLAQLQARHDREVSEIAARAEADRAQREASAAALKALKEERAKEKQAVDELKKKEAELAKEQAAVLKEEKRVKALEEKAEKQARQREEAIEKAKRKAEQQAQQAEERARKILERQEAVRNQVLARNAKIAAQQELAAAQKQAFEQKRQELALEAEIARKTRVQQEEAALKAVEEKIAREKAEKAKVDEKLRQIRMQTLRATADGARVSATHPHGARLASPATYAAREPEPLSAHYERSQTQASHMPAGYAALLQRYRALDATPESQRSPEDSELAAAIHGRLMELINNSRTELRKEREESIAAAQGISPMAESYEGSVRLATAEPVDHVQEQQHDRPTRYPTLSLPLDHDEQTTADTSGYPTGGTAEGSRARVPLSAGGRMPDTPYYGYSDESAPYDKTLRRNNTIATTRRRPRHTPSPEPDKVRTTGSVLYEFFQPHGKQTFSVDPLSNGEAVYMSLNGLVPGKAITQVGGRLRACYSSALPGNAAPEEIELWQIEGRGEALRALARRVALKGCNAILKATTYQPVQDPETGEYDFFAGGETVVCQAVTRRRPSMGRRRSSTGSDCSEPFWGLFGNGKDLDKFYY